MYSGGRDEAGNMIRSSQADSAGDPLPSAEAALRLVIYHHTIIVYYDITR